MNQKNYCERWIPRLIRKKRSFLLVFAWLNIVCTFAVTPELDPAFLEQASELVLRQRWTDDPAWKELVTILDNPDDAFREREHKRVYSDYIQRVRQHVRTLPGLKPYLFHFLHEGLNGADSNRVEKVRLSLEALAEREDLIAGDVEKTRAEVAKVFANPRAVDGSAYDIERDIQNQYLMSAMPILGRDLTSESENLLLQALAWPHDGAVNASAAKVLTAAGVARAVPVMQATIDRLTAQDHPYAEKLRPLLDTLKQTVDRKSPFDTVVPDISKPPLASKSVFGSPAASQSNERSSWVWAIIVICFSGVALLFWKRRLR